MNEHEIADAWCDFQTKFFDFLRQPRQPFFIMRNGLGDVRIVSHRGNARGHRGTIDVERSPDAIERVGDARGRLAPAETEQSEAVNL